MRAWVWALVSLFAVALGGHESANSTGLCGEQEPMHTGYLNSLYYVFYESRQQVRDHAPLVIWLSGGPGCSSLVGMLFENGPCLVGEESSVAKVNPSSWTNAADMLYIDQPRGTGFSPPRLDRQNWYESDVSTDLVGFLDAFYDKYPSFATKDLYVFGESYAGHYVPDFVFGLLHRSATVASSPHASQIVKNLKGMGIGNGLTSPAAMYGTIGEFAEGLTKGKLKAATREEVARCHEGIQRCQEAAHGGYGDCTQLTPCQALMSNVLDQAHTFNLNYYDLRAQCHTDDPFQLCYRFTPLYSFLNAPSTLSTLGISGKTWTPCSHDVFTHYAEFDYFSESEVKVATILDHGIRVLVYAGDQDLVCNWKSQDQWTKDMVWTHQADFARQPLGNYVHNKAVVGELRQYDGLSFLRVYQSGHMVPLDQPEVALDMFERFVSNRL